MANTLSIDPTTVYDEGAVSLALDIPLSTIDRARRSGRLRFARTGRRVFILGKWLIQWFETEQGGKSTNSPHEPKSGDQSLSDR
jgi:hypothetical protein